MATKIFVNLPIANLDRSVEFFKRVGYSFNPQFTDETATCMVISEDIYAMLLTHPKFKTFIPGEISDALKQTEVLVCLSCDSRQAVDDVIARAIVAGGTTYRDPDDHGFMYGRSYQDLDGHIWEYVWMDSAAIMPQE
jgi:predicted lactoylglutathione lyase